MVYKARLYLLNYNYNLPDEHPYTLSPLFSSQYVNWLKAVENDICSKLHVEGLKPEHHGCEVNLRYIASFQQILSPYNGKRENDKISIQRQIQYWQLL